MSIDTYTVLCRDEEWMRTGVQEAAYGIPGICVGRTERECVSALIQSMNLRDVKRCLYGGIQGEAPIEIPLTINACDNLDDMMLRIEGARTKRPWCADKINDNDVCYVRSGGKAK